MTTAYVSCVAPKDHTEPLFSLAHRYRQGASKDVAEMPLCHNDENSSTSLSSTDEEGTCCICTRGLELVKKHIFIKSKRYATSLTWTEVRISISNNKKVKFMSYLFSSRFFPYYSIQYVFLSVWCPTGGRVLFCFLFLVVLRYAMGWAEAHGPAIR